MPPIPGKTALRVPLAKGRIGHEPFSPQAAPAQGRHVGLYARLIDEDEPGRLAAHETCSGKYWNQSTACDEDPYRRRSGELMTR